MYSNRKQRSRWDQKRLSYKIRPRNHISKNLMEICGDGNSNNIDLSELNNEVTVYVTTFFCFLKVYR
jgi:hypothetical protein